MAKREFLLLAHPWDERKYGIGNWFVSEKLDGVRAIWDGGLTRGVPASEVPFANVEKDGRYKVPPVATGLWTRYGKVIQAPAWWLDMLPDCPLDGELYAGRGRFQHVTATVKDLEPGPGWGDIRFAVFDSPRLGTVFADGVVAMGPRTKVLFRDVVQRLRADEVRQYTGPFERVLSRLRDAEKQNEVFTLHPQEQLPAVTAQAVARVYERLDEVTAAGGEGLILRAPHSVWLPERSRQMLKVKKWRDAEGTVTGYVWGRRTELGSKLLGLMGALVVRTDEGKRLELSGFTDEERVMLRTGEWASPLEDARAAGSLHAGEVVSPEYHNPRFPVGSRVTYRFREFTDGGVPKEARYWRRHR